MKPKEKSITAQDVQSSLYYVHVDSIHDYELLTSDESDDDEPVGYGTQTAVSPSSKPSVRREALPQTSHSATFDPLNPYGPNSQPLTYTNGSIIARKPIGPVGPERRSAAKVPNLPERGLLGPRPMNQHHLSVDSAALQKTSSRKDIDVRRWSTLAAPQLHPRPYPITKGKLHSETQTADSPIGKPRSIQDGRELITEHCWDWEKKWEEQRLSDDLARRRSSRYSLSKAEDALQNASLTLIRRYNGEQWNTSRIIPSGTVPAPNDSARAATGMSIEILTAGYSKFCDVTALQREEKEIGNNGSSKNIPIIRQGPSISSDDEARLPPFRRHLRLRGNVRRRHEDHKLGVEDSSATSGARSSVDSRSHSQQSPNRIDPPAQVSPEHKTSSPRPYQFGSPWNGVCEFSTGIAGRSLKCKHSHPLYSTDTGPGIHPTTISELRFNLPSSKALGSPMVKSSIPGTPREVKRSSIFSRHPGRGSFSSFGGNETIESDYFGSKVEPEDRLDLSLGQERAGGGFGGKQTKLGKLIIENEGLQMLDLIISANMALWWKVYEKSS